MLVGLVVMLVEWCSQRYKPHAYQLFEREVAYPLLSAERKLDCEKIVASECAWVAEMLLACQS